MNDAPPEVIPGDLGPAISAGLLALMAGALFLAPLADRIGRRPVLIASTILFGAGTLATLWTRDLGGALLNAHVSIALVFNLTAVPAICLAVLTVVFAKRRSSFG